MQPDVFGDCGGMVLAQGIFVSLVVFIEAGAVRTDGQGRYGEGGDELGGGTVQGGLVQGRISGEPVKARALEVGMVPGEIDAAIRADGQRGLCAGQGCEALGDAAFGGGDIEVLATFPLRGEDQDLPVRGPERIGLMGAV